MHGANFRKKAETFDQNQHSRVRHCEYIWYGAAQRKYFWRGRVVDKHEQWWDKLQTRAQPLHNSGIQFDLVSVAKLNFPSTRIVMQTKSVFSIGFPHTIQYARIAHECGVIGCAHSSLMNWIFVSLIYKANFDNWHSAHTNTQTAHIRIAMTNVVSKWSRV